MSVFAGMSYDNYELLWPKYGKVVLWWQGRETHGRWRDCHARLIVVSLVSVFTLRRFAVEAFECSWTVLKSYAERYESAVEMVGA
jgi:hypothetical protein